VPPKHHHHTPAARVKGTDHAVPQVLLGIGDLIGNGLLGTREDDGLVRVLDKVGQRRRRVGQRIGAVADDEAIVKRIVFLHSLGHHQPVLRAKVGAVDAAQIERFRAAELLQFRQMGQQLLAGQNRLEPLCGAHAGNGAAGGDKKQALLGHRFPLHGVDFCDVFSIAQFIGDEKCGELRYNSYHKIKQSSVQPTIRRNCHV
jgi:hypothetical protein